MQKRYLLSEVMSDFLSEEKEEMINEIPDFIIDDPQTASSVASTGRGGHIPGLSAAEKTARLLSAAAASMKGKIEKVARGSIPDSEYAKLVAAAVGILGRESDYGGAGKKSILDQIGYNAKDYLEREFNKGGLVNWIATATGYADASDHKASVGPAQINLELHVTGDKVPVEMKNYAKSIGIAADDDLVDISKSGLLVLGILAKNYVKAKNVGYSTTKPSVPGLNPDAYDIQAILDVRGQSSFVGTGNAALDMALTAYNAGYGRIINHVTDANYRKKYPDHNITDVNYLPCIGAGCTDTSSAGPTTIGYVREVFRNMEKVQGEVNRILKIEPPAQQTIDDFRVAVVDLGTDGTEDADPPIPRPFSDFMTGPELPATVAAEVPSLSVSKEDIFGSSHRSWSNAKWKDFIDDAAAKKLLPPGTTASSLKSSWARNSRKYTGRKGSISSAREFYDMVKSGKYASSDPPLQEGLSRASMYRKRYGRY